MVHVRPGTGTFIWMKSAGGALPKLYAGAGDLNHTNYFVTFFALSLIESVFYSYLTTWM